MTSRTILYCEIMEKVGEVRLLPRSGRDETRPYWIARMDVNYGR